MLINKGINEIHNGVVYIEDNKIIINKNAGYEVKYSNVDFDSNLFDYLGFKKSVKDITVYKLINSGGRVGETLLILKGKHLYFIKLNDKDTEGLHYISELLLNTGIDLDFIFKIFINKENEITLNKNRVIYRGYMDTKDVYVKGNDADNLMWEDIGIYLIEYQGKQDIYLDYIDHFYTYDNKSDIGKSRYNIMLNLTDFKYYLIYYNHLGYRDRCDYDINMSISRIKEYKDIKKIILIDGLGSDVHCDFNVWIYKDRLDCTYRSNDTSLLTIRIGGNEE